MILQFVNWTVRPEIFLVENVHLTQGMLFLGVLLCIIWAAADVIARRRAMAKWRQNGSPSASKPDNSAFGFYMAGVIGILLLFKAAGSPEGIDFGPVGVRWYGLMFLIGFIVGYWIVWSMFRHEGAPEQWVATLLIYVAVATIVGARLGHCFFYEWDYYSAHPEKIIAFWEGGLASHGGTIAIIIAIFIYSRAVTHKSPLWTFDRLVVAIAFVAALIRMGNLFNSEIFGHATTLPWGFKFPLSREWQIEYAPTDSACHPTQLYEAGTYMLLFVLLMWMYWRKNAQERPGLILGIFFIGVFLPRILIEFVKNPQEEFERDMLLNMGQLLSVPFVLAGILLVYRALTRPKVKLTFPNKFPEND